MTRMTRCGVCGRVLKAEKSVAAGVGPECGRKGKKRKGKPLQFSGDNEGQMEQPQDGIEANRPNQ
jgi:hypothetical protein